MAPAKLSFLLFVLGVGTLASGSRSLAVADSLDSSVLFQTPTASAVAPKDQDRLHRCDEVIRTMFLLDSTLQTRLVGPSSPYYVEQEDKVCWSELLVIDYQPEAGAKWKVYDTGVICERCMSW